MSYHPNDRPSGLRWRPEGIELRCNGCPAPARWWPLTEEFWYFHKSFNRCRACYDTAKRKSDQESARRPEARAARIAYARTYRQEASRAKALKAWDRYWADPELHRAKKRAYHQANREQILAKKRAAYAARKAA